MNKYSYKIQVGDSKVSYNFYAENTAGKPMSTPTGYASPDAWALLSKTMSDSSSIDDFIQRIYKHGACSFSEDPYPASTSSSSSGTSWGSSASSDEDDE